MTEAPYSMPFSEFDAELRAGLTRKQIAALNKEYRRVKKQRKRGLILFEVEPFFSKPV
jgi:hypothetical protein